MNNARPAQPAAGADSAFGGAAQPQIVGRQKEESAHEQKTARNTNRSNGCSSGHGVLPPVPVPRERGNSHKSRIWVAIRSSKTWLFSRCCRYRYVTYPVGRCCDRYRYRVLPYEVSVVKRLIFDRGSSMRRRWVWASGKVSTAVQILATDPGDARHRVWKGADHFLAVSTSDVPITCRADVEAIQKKLMRRSANSLLQVQCGSDVRAHGECHCRKDRCGHPACLR